MGRPLDDYQRLLLKIVSPTHMAKLLKMVADGRITRASGLEVLHIMFDRAEAMIGRMAEALPKKPREPATVPASSWACRYDYLSKWEEE